MKNIFKNQHQQVSGNYNTHINLVEYRTFSSEPEVVEVHDQFKVEVLAESTPLKVPF